MVLKYFTDKETDSVNLILLAQINDLLFRSEKEELLSELSMEYRFAMPRFFRDIQCREIIEALFN